MSAVGFPGAESLPLALLAPLQVLLHGDLVAALVLMALVRGPCIVEVCKPLRESQDQWLSKEMFVC